MMEQWSKSYSAENIYSTLKLVRSDVTNNMRYCKASRFYGKPELPAPHRILRFRVAQPNFFPSSDNGHFFY
jgi:hypothetical protein